MPLKTDFNVSPYFDDYDENKNYHRVLFRPAVAVQARELTQLQTILQNQIERFGNWAFRNGDIVSGCNISDIPLLAYVRVADFASNGSANVSPLDVQDYVNAIATSATNGLKAKVLYANAGFTTNYPETNILYVKYINTGSGGEQRFSNSELLTFETVSVDGNTALTNVYTMANTSPSRDTTGNAHGITVSAGIIFINGNFVRVENDTFGLVNTYGTYAGNNVVGFNLIEQVVTENQDETLFDNALGYSNENAPGAHRLKLSPQVISLTQEQAANTESFNPIASYNFGSLVVKSLQSSNLYSIVGDAIAKRTYEESGNYVVNPFIVDTVTNVIGTDIAPSSSNNVLGRVSTGIGYSQGKRVEILKTSYINMRRGVDTQVLNAQQISFNYGSYFILNEVSGAFEFNKAQTVTLYDSLQKSISNRTFATTTPSGNVIGTATVRCYSFSGGTPGTASSTYVLHIFNVKMNVGYNTSQIKSVYYNGTKKGVADVVSVGVVDGQFKRQLYGFGSQGIKNLRDASNNVETSYTYRTKTSGTILTTGNVVVTLTTSATGGTDSLPFGVGILSDSNASDFTLIATSNVDSSALSGTVSVNTTSVNVLGTSTTFNNIFYIGDNIKVGSEIRTVTGVTNSTFMTIDTPFSVVNASANYYKSYISGKILPINKNFSSGPTSYIEVTNTTSFTVASGQIPSSSLSVDIIHNVLRSTTTPAKKEIKRNRFVKIDTSSNPKGPWCLGFSDIHKVNKVYGSSGSYTTSGVDLTSSFTYDTGQKDTHYDLGYLYAKSGYDFSSYPNLLVELDYFVSNTASGVGFFTVESYPIDDANTANTNAIQTKDITLYVDENGAKLPLRDFVDFRTTCSITANDTGNIVTSNSSQVTTAISYATVNPSSNLTLNTGDPTSGLNVPAYGKNFQASYTRYLPRKDLVMITPDNIIKVKEGVSSVNPQTPLWPDNAMVISVINVPVYPSLSSDQLDEIYPINQNSKNLIRDVSCSISGIMVSNRRYTMKDIGTLDQRITNLEYYTQLSLLEKAAKDLTVTDSNGLDRFKNGIFVDPFSDFSLGDVSNPEYSIAIDTSKGVARPRIIREVVNIKFNEATSVNTRKTGRLISIDYDEVPFLEQPYATKFRSSALVAYAWNGSVILIPSYDNNSDIHNTGSINITIDNTKPWKDFAASPLGSSWGDWRTTTTTTTNTVITGTQTIINRDIGTLGVAGSGRQIDGNVRFNVAGNRFGFSRPNTVDLATAEGRETALAMAAQELGVSVDVIRGHLTVVFDEGFQGLERTFNF
jgi:hypothetical protein